MGKIRIERFKENLKQNLLGSLDLSSLIVPFADEYIEAYREIIIELLNSVPTQESKNKIAEKLYQKSIELIKIEENSSIHNIPLIITLLLEGAYKLFKPNSEEKAKAALFLASQLEAFQLQINETSLQVNNQLLTQEIYPLAEDIVNLYQAVFDYGSKHHKAIAAYRLYIIHRNENTGNHYLNYLIQYLLSGSLNESQQFLNTIILQNSKIKEDVIYLLTELKTKDEIHDLFNEKDNALIFWLGGELAELKNQVRNVAVDFHKIEIFQPQINKALEDPSLQNLFMNIDEDEKINYQNAYIKTIHEYIHTKSSQEKDKIADRLFAYCLKQLTNATDSALSDKLFLMLEGANKLYTTDSMNAAKAALLYAIMLEELHPAELPGLNIYRLYKKAFQNGDEKTKIFAACKLYKIQKFSKEAEKYLENVIYFLSSNTNDVDYQIPKLNNLYAMLLDQDVMFALSAQLVKTRSPVELAKLLNSDSLLVCLLRENGTPLDWIKTAVGIKIENLIDVLANP